METAGAILLVVAAYIVGAVPWGVVLGRTIKGIDIRRYGSGGTGATNSLRVLGAPISIAVLVLDLAKGLVPVLLARLFDLPDLAVALAAVAPVIGHCWSPYIGFRGGKGMATGGGAAVALFPWLLVILLPMALVVYLTRYVSLASLSAAAIGTMAAIAWAAISDFPGWWAAAIAAIAGIIYWQHRSNIQRLLSGTENKFGQRVAG